MIAPRSRGRIGSRTAIGVALALAALSLTGCAVGPSNEQNEQQLESIATKHIHGLNGAFVSLSYDGSAQAILLVLYTKTADPAVLARDVNEGFKVMWKDASFRPASVAVSVAHRTKPTHPQTVDVEAADPRPIATTLSIAQRYTTSTWIDIPDTLLISRYGDRTK